MIHRNLDVDIIGLVSFKFTSPCVQYVSKNRVTK